MMTGMPILMGLVGAVMVGLGLAGLPGGPPGLALVPFTVLWFGFLGFFAFRMLRMPNLIEWHGDGSVSFRSPLRTVRVGVAQIESIRPSRSNLGFFELRYAGKKLIFIHQFDGFHEFLARLEQANPGIELLGC